MTTAIVTITCPHCGGDVSGIESTEDEQTIECPYCKTEMHVPHVGEEVVREVVHERVVERPASVERPLHRDPPQPPNAMTAVVAALLIIGCIVLFAMATVGDNRVQSPPDPPPASLPASDPNTDCVLRCSDNCDKIPGENGPSDPRAMCLLQCVDGCNRASKP